MNFDLFLQDKLRYSIVGDDIAKQFFYIDADMGLITVKRLLTEDDQTQYNVSHNQKLGNFSSTHSYKIMLHSQLCQAMAVNIGLHWPFA